MRAVQATVSGRVQGVGYRYSCVQEAQRLGVLGWVRNLPDGRVELWAEGEDDAVQALLDWCGVGPGWARVDDVAVRPASPTGFTGFDVR